VYFCTIYLIESLLASNRAITELFYVLLVIEAWDGSGDKIIQNFSHNLCGQASCLVLKIFPSSLVEKPPPVKTKHAFFRVG